MNNPRPKPATIALAAALLLAAQNGANAADIVGRTYVVDGDGLRIGRQEIRICGISAPEWNAPGGRASTKALQRLVAGKRVQCVPVGEGTVCDGRSKRMSYDRVVAQCFVGNVDLAAEMVRQGHAEDWPRFSGGYYGKGQE